MLQIINISSARNNLAKLIKSVSESKKPVVIVQDSKPAVVVYPYEEVFKREAEENQQFEAEFNDLLKQGKKIFKKYLSKNQLPSPKTDDEAYQLIKHG